MCGKISFLLSLIIKCYLMTLYVNKYTVGNEVPIDNINSKFVNNFDIVILSLISLLLTIN